MSKEERGQKECIISVEFWAKFEKNFQACFCTGPPSPYAGAVHAVTKISTITHRISVFPALHSSPIPRRASHHFPDPGRTGPGAPVCRPTHPSAYPPTGSPIPMIPPGACCTIHNPRYPP